MRKSFDTTKGVSIAKSVHYERKVLFAAIVSKSLNIVVIGSRPLSARVAAPVSAATDPHSRVWPFVTNIVSKRGVGVDLLRAALRRPVELVNAEVNIN